MQCGWGPGKLKSFAAELLKGLYGFQEVAEASGEA